MAILLPCNMLEIVSHDQFISNADFQCPGADIRVTFEGSQKCPNKSTKFIDREISEEFNCSQPVR